MANLHKSPETPPLITHQAPPSSCKLSRRKQQKQRDEYLDNTYQRYMVLCILYTVEEPDLEDISESAITRVKWVPIKAYLNAIRTGIIRLHPSSRDKTCETFKLVDWRPPAAEYCNVWFGKSAVEEIYEKNPRGKILIVKTDESFKGSKGHDTHSEWTLPRHRWYDNGIDSPVKALVQSVHDYFPNLKLCWDNVKVCSSEMCSRTPHNANGVCQEITPCTYDLTMNTIYSRVHFPEPEPFVSDSTLSSSSTDKVTSWATQVEPSKERWADMSSEDSMSQCGD